MIVLIELMDLVHGETWAMGNLSYTVNGRLNKCSYDLLSSHQSVEDFIPKPHGNSKSQEPYQRVTEQTRDTIASKLKEGKKPVKLYKELLSSTDDSIASLQQSPSLRTIQQVSRNLSASKNDVEDLIVSLRMDRSCVVRENSITPTSIKLFLATDYRIAMTKKAIELKHHHL